MANRSTKRPYYSVKPRYTPGSPGLVPEDEALRIAADEKAAYEELKREHAGNAYWRNQTEDKGLRGIVEAQVLKGDGHNIHDLITDEQFWRGTVMAKRVLPGDRLLRIDGPFGPVALKSPVVKEVRFTPHTPRVELFSPEGDRVCIGLKLPVTIERPSEKKEDIQALSEP